jgi:hypothetical protein
MAHLARWAKELMFGKQIDEQITMAQRVVALGRDLILAMTAAQAAAIVAFGGDPTKLTTLDWARLLGASIAIIIMPIVAYLIGREVWHILAQVPGSLMLRGRPLPRSVVIDFGLRIFRISPWRYARRVRAFRNRVEKQSVRAPYFWRSYLKAFAFLEKLTAVQKRHFPLTYAFCVPVIAVAYFLATFKRYIPK